MINQIGEPAISGTALRQGNNASYSHLCHHSHPRIASSAGRGGADFACDKRNMNKAVEAFSSSISESERSGEFSGARDSDRRRIFLSMCPAASSLPLSESESCQGTPVGDISPPMVGRSGVCICFQRFSTSESTSCTPSLDSEPESEAGKDHEQTAIKPGSQLPFQVSRVQDDSM